MKNNPRLRPLLAACAAAALLLALFCFIQPRASYAAGERAASSAHIAVQFAPGHQELRQIGFTAPISGLLALQQAGYTVETADFGGGYIAVCAINGVGCPADDCFCDSQRFWNYEYWDGSQWNGYLVGASASTLADGAFEGWRWAEWGSGALPSATQLQAGYKALAWLAQQQSQADGGYGSSSYNVESLLAIGANGLPAAGWRRASDSPSLLGAAIAGSGAYTRNAASNAGKFAVAMAGAGGCMPYPASQPQAFYQPASGWFSPDAGVHAWAMLGTGALSQTLPVSASLYLKSLQQSDGGWEWTAGGFGNGTDTNTTALAVQALVAAGEPLTATAITNALAYLHGAQNDDGGFPYDPDSPYGTASDANSTAYVAQALAALGQDPSAAAWTPAGKSAIAYLLALQLPDGSLEWQAGSGANLMATQQAIPALLGRAYPLAARPLSACPTNFMPVARK